MPADECVSSGLQTFWIDSEVQACETEPRRADSVVAFFGKQLLYAIMDCYEEKLFM